MVVLVLVAVYLGSAVFIIIVVYKYPVLQLPRASQIQPSIASRQKITIVLQCQVHMYESEATHYPTRQQQPTNQPVAYQERPLGLISILPPRCVCSRVSYSSINELVLLSLIFPHIVRPDFR